MTNEFAYLLGMILGNGEIVRDNQNTQINIDIPHKKLETDSCRDIDIYVKASLVDINRVLSRLASTNFDINTGRKSTIFSFQKNNNDYLIQEILRLTGNVFKHDYMRMDASLFTMPADCKRMLLKGIADVTGYIRRSNYAFANRYEHRAYIEIPANWYMVVDICNMLKDVDVPVQTIDWAHPNMRDGLLKKYNSGQVNFWKKEHQIKIFANEFLKIGFNIKHKNDALQRLADEEIKGFSDAGRDISATHHFYWEKSPRKGKVKPPHPGENDAFIPEEIRGQHFNSWTEIARKLGYHE